MENQSDNLSLYELISYIEDVDIPPEFESELLHFILGLSDGVKVARIISQIFEGRSLDATSEFIEALEDHILEVMYESFSNRENLNNAA